MRQFRTSGSVGGLGGNSQVYPARGSLSATPREESGDRLVTRSFGHDGETTRPQTIWSDRLRVRTIAG
jgi:hypothetical protein